MIELIKSFFEDLTFFHLCKFTPMYIYIYIYICIVRNTHTYTAYIYTHMGDWPNE